MAASSAVASFSLEDYQAITDVPGLLQRLLPQLNQLKTEIDGALGNGLTLGANFNASLKSVDLTTAARWLTPSFSNSWTNFSSSITARYTKDGALVRLAGGIKGGTVNTPAFTLPAGYLPEQDSNFAVQSNSALGVVVVNAAGLVTPTVGANSFVSLDGVSFLAADATPVPKVGTALKVATDLKTNAKGVLVLEAYQQNRADLRLPIPSITWANNGMGQILLSDVQGLPPAATTTLSLLILGG